MAQSEASKQIKRINANLNTLKKIFGAESEIYSRNVATLTNIFGSDNIKLTRSGNISLRNDKSTQRIIETNTYYTYYVKKGNTVSQPHETSRSLNRISWTKDVIKLKKSRLEATGSRYTKSQVIQEIIKEDREAVFIREHMDDIYAYEFEKEVTIIGNGPIDEKDYIKFKEWYYGRQYREVKDQPNPLRA